MPIKNLVEKYIENRTYYLTSEYNETLLRSDFLDPFFELLGWDIRNSKGKSTNEREVLLEEALKEDTYSTTKKPDYTFRLFSERKFFLEAKKPSVKIELDEKSAKQVRRYGFTAKLKISVLSNFEYLAIYDCSQKVELTDLANNSRIKLYHYLEYEEKFEEIKEQLSHEVVYNGIFDEAWKDIEAQLERFSVDKLFLKQINDWRILLGKEIFSHKNDLTINELNDIVQSYINSIVFLRVCEDRDLEIYKTLLNYANEANFNALINKFKQSDKKYNAGLFSHDLVDEIISNNSSSFWIIIKQLYFPESTYSFSVFASDILGSIYEIFLAEQLNIIENEVFLVKKPEHVNRDIVTTPTFVIQDILRKTILEHCKHKSDKEILDSTFADIACGSGAFLLEIYQLLHDILVDYYLLHEPSKLIQISISSYKLPFNLKKQILENCIFGVDKDFNAVEACKFGLVLKLLENENNSSITIPALPSLDDNIHFGNSLISSNKTDDTNFDEINPFDFGDTKFDVVVGNPPYMSTENIKKFTPLEKPIFERIYQSAYKQYDKYFLFIEQGINFLKENGYLGYIVPSKFTKVGAGEKLRELLVNGAYLEEIISFGANQIFQNKTTYTSILILSKKSNKIFTNTEVKKLKEWKTKDLDKVVSEQVNISSLSSDLWFLVPPYLKKTYNEILKKSLTLKDLIGKKNINNGIQTSANDIFIIHPIKEDENYLYFIKNDIEFKVERKITKPYYETVKDKKEDKLYTYRTLVPNSFAIFPYNDNKEFIHLDELKTNYPETFKYISNKQIKHRLIYQKNDKDLRSINPVPKTKNEWYRYGRSQYLELGLIKEKIIVGVNSTGNKYPLDFSQTLHTAGGTAGYCSIFLSDDSPYSIYYIQAILNSKYLEWIISLKGEVFRGGYISRGTKVLENLPIRVIDFDNKEDRSLHDNITSLQKELIKIQEKIDKNKGNNRESMPLKRQFKNKKVELERLLNLLYNLEDDTLIPNISDIYAID